MLIRAGVQMLPSTVRMFHKFCALISRSTLVENEGEGAENLHLMKLMYRRLIQLSCCTFKSLSVFPLLTPFSEDL